MKTQEIVQKLWSLCDVLRDDGITYHQYVTELTYILFLKMAKETGAEAIATCCPYCEQNLNDPIQRNNEKMKLYDLTDLMLMAMDG